MLTISDPRMRERSRPPFQARVASVAIVTTVAVLVAACVCFMLQQWSVSRQQAAREELTLANVIAAAAAPDVAAGDMNGIRHDVAAATAERDLIDVRLTDATGGRTLAYFAAPPPKSNDVGPAHSVSAPVTASGKVVGQLVLRAREPTIVG